MIEGVNMCIKSISSEKEEEKVDIFDDKRISRTITALLISSVIALVFYFCNVSFHILSPNYDCSSDKTLKAYSYIDRLER